MKTKETKETKQGFIVTAIQVVGKDKVFEEFVEGDDFELYDGYLIITKRDKTMRGYAKNTWFKIIRT